MSKIHEGRQSPVLRLSARPSDINANGHIFGGWVLAQMDLAGGILAVIEAQGSAATVAIEQMSFVGPILLRDIVSVYANIVGRGRTSIKIEIEVFATREGKDVKVTEGLFTFVALDENGRPRPLPNAPMAEVEPDSSFETGGPVKHLPSA